MQDDPETPGRLSCPLSWPEDEEGASSISWSLQKCDLMAGSRLPPVPSEETSRETDRKTFWSQWRFLEERPEQSEITPGLLGAPALLEM